MPAEHAAELSLNQTLGAPPTRRPLTSIRTLAPLRARAASAGAGGDGGAHAALPHAAQGGSCCLPQQQLARSACTPPTMLSGVACKQGFATHSRDTDLTACPEQRIQLLSTGASACTTACTPCFPLALCCLCTPQPCSQHPHFSPCVRLLKPGSKVALTLTAAATESVPQAGTLDRPRAGHLGALPRHVHAWRGVLRPVRGRSSEWRGGSGRWGGGIPDRRCGPFLAGARPGADGPLLLAGVCRSAVCVGGLCF